jgi:hypothetical protein
MPQITPVEYQPTSGPPPTAAPTPQPTGPGRRYDPKISSRNRVILLTIGAAILSVVWLLICIFFPPIQPLSVVIVGGVALVVWTAFSILTHQDEAFFLRLTGTGDLFVLLWMVITSGLLLLNFFPIPSGWFAIWVLWLLSLTLPVWVIEMEPGEVFYHRPIHHRPYRYQLIGLDIQSQAPAARNGDSLNDPRMPGFVRPFVVSSPVMQNAAQVALNIDFIWVRPIDELRLLWKLEKRIVIEHEIRDIVTNDNSNFTLWMKAAANHDPRKITAAPILLRLPSINSPAELETILSKSLLDAVEKTARLYFINKSAAEARGQDGVIGFRSRLGAIAKTLDEVMRTNGTHPQGDELYNVFKGLKEGLGVSVLEASLNSTPIITPEVRGAAEHAAARYDAARADLATTNDIIERATRNDIDAQYLLYTRLIERGHQLHYAPPASEMPLSRDSILQQLRSMNPAEASRFVRVLVDAFPALANAPELAEFLSQPPALPSSAPQQALPGPNFEPNAATPPPAEIPNFDSNAPVNMPRPAPERLRVSPDFRPDQPPVAPPETMPEQPKPKPSPPTLPKPSFNIGDAVNTRRRDDDTYEIDLGSKQD